MIKFSDNFHKVESSYCEVLLEVRSMDWDKDRSNERYSSQFVSSGKVFQNSTLLLKHGWRCIEQYKTRVTDGVTYIDVSVRLQKLCKKLFFVHEYAWIECCREYTVAIGEVVHPHKLEGTFTYAKRVMLMSILGVVGIDNDDNDGNGIELTPVSTSVFNFVEQLKASLRKGTTTKEEVVVLIDERLAHEKSPLLENFKASLQKEKIPVLNEVITDKNRVMSEYAYAISSAKTPGEVNKVMSDIRDNSSIDSTDKQRLTSLAVRQTTSFNNVEKKTA